MTRIELEMFVAVPSEEFNTYWIPSTWFISLLKQAKRSNRIMDSQGLKIIMEVRLLTFLFVVFFLWRARLIKRRNRVELVALVAAEDSLFAAAAPKHARPRNIIKNIN